MIDKNDFAIFFACFILIEFIIEISSWWIYVEITDISKMERNFSFIVLFSQLIVRNMFGNLIFSWFIYRMQMTPWLIAITNIIFCVVLLFVIDAFFVERALEVMLLQHVPPIGAFIWLGIILSSGIMAFLTIPRVR